jgi:ribosome-binding factor A
MHRKPSRKDLLALCNEPGRDDGIDPRLEARDENQKVPNRKALQLCRQVAHALGLALGECCDDVLRDLAVASVVPAPTSARLLATVYVATSAGRVDAAAVLERLQKAQGLLRTEVAAAIHRRKTPELRYRVVRHSGPLA